MLKGRGKNKILGFVSLTALTMVAGLAFAADTYKLYINKDQNSANVVVFENTLVASVKHTAEGMELTIPGVEVSLRCKSTDANNTSDSCLIAIAPGTTATTSTGSTSGSTSGSTTDTSAPASTSGSGTNTSGDCVVTSWNPCTGSTGSTGATDSTGSTGSTDSTGGTTTTTGSTGNTGGSGSCGGGIDCGTLNFGSAGQNASGNTNLITVNAGVTLAMPFTTNSGQYYGQVSVVPTSSELPQDGTVLRMWLSAEAGGAVLGSRCSMYPAFEGSIGWDQTGTKSRSCQVKPNSSYFLNYKLCSGSRDDRNCSSPTAATGTDAAKLFTTGRIYN